MSTFTTVDDQVLVEYIRGAQKRIVFVAPGLFPSVADAIAARVSGPGDVSVSLILDSDPEVCRLGYGHIDALRTVMDLVDQKGIDLRHQPGLRLGLLIVDEVTILYAPTPRLIEATTRRAETRDPVEAKVRQPDKPNAVVLGAQVSSMLESACGAGRDSLPLKGEIGRGAVTPALVKEVAEDLDRMPPKEFDVARIERVFSSLLQYVDLNITGYKLSAKQAPVPPYLLGLEADSDLASRWKNTFKPFAERKLLNVRVPCTEDDSAAMRKSEDGKRDYGEEALERERKQIEDRFFIGLFGFGTFIKRADRPVFDARIERLRERLQIYSDEIAKKVAAVLDAQLVDLSSVLLPLIKEKPPVEYLKHSLSAKPSEDELMHFIREDLRRAFDAVKTMVVPKLEVRFQELAYETIKEPKFRKALEQVFSPATVIGLFTEHDAAPEKGKGKSAN